MRKIQFKRTRIIMLISTLALSVAGFAQTATRDSFLEKVVSALPVLSSIFRTSGGVTSAESSTAVLAVETWSGSAGDSNWSSNLNWEGVGGAGADDDLIFDASNRVTNVNDFPVNTRFRSISIGNSNYSITGNQILLSAGISNTGANNTLGARFSPNIILDANQTFSAQFNSLVLNGVVNLNGHTLNIGGGGAGVVFNNIINGTGTLNVGTGALAFINDPSSAFGSSEIDDLGDLKVIGTGSLGAVNLNGGTLHGTGTVGAITANATNGGVINPGINDGSPSGATGILNVVGASTLNSNTEVTFNLFGPTIGTQFDRIAISGAGFNLNNADLRVLVGAGFEPSIGQQFTIMTQTGTGDITGQFQQGPTVNSGGRFFGITYNASSIVVTHLGNVATWDGSSDTSWGTGGNWDVNSGPQASNAGMDLVFPAGAQRLVNSNNVPGLSLGSLAFSGTGYEISGQSIQLAEGITNTAVPGSINVGLNMTLTAQQTFSSNAGTLLFTGTVNQGIHRITIEGAGTQSFSTIQGNASNPGGGGIAKNGSGTLRLTSNGTNYKGQSIFNSGVVELHSSNPLGAFQDSSDKTTVNSGASLRIINNLDTQETFELTGSGVAGEGALVGAGCSTCILNEQVTLLAATTIGVPTAGRSITINDQVLGASTLTKTGSGNLILNAPSEFSGTIAINSGGVVVNHSMASAPVSLNGGTISGVGTIGSVSGTGTVAPGTSPGILTVSGNATFGASTNLNIELNGTTAGTQHDRLVVTGTTNLGGANLVGSLGFTPTNGQQFTIIQSTGAITGQFAQGSSINIGGTNFGITYNANSVVLSAGPASANAPFDYDADGKSDVSVFRPSNGTWFVGLSGNSTMYVQPWGLNGDTIVPADYDGDGKTDLAVRRPGDNNFYIFNSANSTVEVRNFGIAGDIAIPSDYNGDGKADVAVWRPSNGTWFLSLSGSGIFYVMPWGLSTDKPVPGDFDGDGKTELAVFRPSDGKWYTFNTVTGTISVTEWGVNGDLPVQGDYNGDGRTDFAVYRPSNNTWFRQNSNDGAVSSIQWGLPGDFVVPGDYDGDGKIDVAVWRPSDTTWYVNRTSSGIFTQTFGVNGDKPTPSAFVF